MPTDGEPVEGRTPPPCCLGPARREILRLGLAGFAGLTWPGLLRLRAGAGKSRPDTALLVVWLHGGGRPPGTHDPKPHPPPADPRPHPPAPHTRPRFPGVRPLPRPPP